MRYYGRAKKAIFLYHFYNMKKVTSTLLLVLFLTSGCGLFKKEPQQVVNDGFVKFVDVKKRTSDLVLAGTIQLPSTGEETGGSTLNKITFALNLAGQGDMSDKDSPKFATTAKLNLDVDGKKAAAVVELRSLDKKLYVKVNSISVDGAQGATIQQQLESFLNMWWILPLGETPLDGIAKEQQQLEEKFKTTPFFTNAQEEGVDDVHGVSAVRYRIDLDKTALKNFIVDVVRIGGTQLSPQEETAIGDGLKDFEFSGAVSIGDDDVLHRIKGTIANQDVLGGSRKVELDYAAWDYDESFEISVPDGAREFSALMMLPLAGVLGSLSGSMMDGATATGTAPLELGAETTKPLSIEAPKAGAPTVTPVK